MNVDLAIKTLRSPLTTPRVAAILEKQASAQAEMQRTKSELSGVTSAVESSTASAVQAYLEGNASIIESPEEVRARLSQRIAILDAALAHIQIILPLEIGLARQEVVREIKLIETARAARKDVFTRALELFRVLRDAETLATSIEFNDLGMGSDVWTGFSFNVMECVSGLVVDLAETGLDLAPAEKAVMMVRAGRASPAAQTIISPPGVGLQRDGLEMAPPKNSRSKAVSNAANWA